MLGKSKRLVTSYFIIISIVSFANAQSTSYVDLLVITSERHLFIDSRSLIGRYSI